jgi:hypothetical protein
VPAKGGWNSEGLEDRGWSVPSAGLDRLSDAPPYFTPDASGLVLFLCRWPTTQAISVSLPSDANPEQRQWIRIALAAWQSAGLGVRFEEVAPERAKLSIEFSETGQRSGEALVNCATPRDFTAQSSPSGRRVDAELVRASIRLHRERSDALGRSVALAPAELVGAALHELGHALGYPGHAARGRSVMVREVQAVERWGERVLAGEAFEAPTLAALYALPAGVVVGHLSAPGVLLGQLERLAGVARSEGWTGPFVRVGDQSARLFWRGPPGPRQEDESAMLVVRDWTALLSKPARFEELAEVWLSPEMTRGAEAPRGP